MIKKYWSIITILAISASLCQFNVFAENNFPDMTQTHWAFEPVSQLVADGTITGYEDGTFKPDNTVLRAEFVKMIGKSSVKRNMNFSDVDSSYWGYDYVMYSGLRGTVDNKFNPEVPITRGDVAQMLWGRAGSKQGVIAPSIITSQYENKDAVAWVYQYGIMIGNDGVNLRLGDTLSRAEAATLIVRSRKINESSKQIDFVNTVSPVLLETVYNSLNLFDNAKYEPEKNITNGEMSRAGLRIATEKNILTYNGYEITAPFAHKYVYDLTAIGSYCFSKDKINKDFIDKKATVQDTLAVLTFSIIKKSHASIVNDTKNNYYKDITSTDNDMANSYLTFANQNGIQLYADGKLNASSAITLKEMVAILLQIDGIVGTQSAITTDSDAKTGFDILLDQKLQKNIELYPENNDTFQLVLADMPKEIYNTPFTITNSNPQYGKPKLLYDLAREYSNIFTGMLQEYKSTLFNKFKVNVRFSYFPSLACENGNGYTLRVKCEVLDIPNELLLKDVFNVGTDVSKTQKIYKGMVFYGDIASGQELSSIQLSSEMATLDKIVYIVK